MPENMHDNAATAPLIYNIQYNKSILTNQSVSVKIYCGGVSVYFARLIGLSIYPQSTSFKSKIACQCTHLKISCDLG